MSERFAMTLTIAGWEVRISAPEGEDGFTIIERIHIDLSQQMSNGEFGRAALDYGYPGSEEADHE